MNALTIKVHDRSKQLSFGETLTTGSRYAVSVEGGAATCGADAALILTDPARGLQVAVAALADGAGTLDLNCDAALKLESRVPFGTVMCLNAVLRCFDAGEEQNVGVGQCHVIAAWQGRENPDTGTVVYYKGPKGEKGDKGDKGDDGFDARQLLTGLTLPTNTLASLRQAVQIVAEALGARTDSGIVG